MTDLNDLWWADQHPDPTDIEPFEYKDDLENNTAERDMKRDIYAQADAEDRMENNPDEACPRCTQRGIDLHCPICNGTGILF